MRSRENRRRLNEEDALEIRRLLASGWKVEDVAERFGVSQTTVSIIRDGLVWPHVRLARRNDT